MRTALAIAGVLLLSGGTVLAQGGVKPAEPCDIDGLSVREKTDCFYQEQSKVNREADALARKVAAGFTKTARDPMYQPVISSILRKGAAEVLKSQRSWRAYRDQHCQAVAYAWTSGSGSGTAQQRCLFELGKLRVQELKTAFWYK